MSAPAFTPGPWHVFASSYAAERHDSVEINDSGGLTVAWAQKFVPAFADNGEANARLISAAPELYEAAENAAKAMRILVEIAEDIKLEGAPVLAERLAELDAALAKATGQ